MINQALIEFNNGNYSKSKRILLELLSKNKKNVEVLEILGVINGIEKKYNKGIYYLSKALYYNPKNPRVYYNRAIIYKEDKKIELAINDLNKSLQLDVNNQEALITLGLCLKEIMCIDDAQITFEKAIIINPKNINALINLGCLYYEKKDYIKSIEIFENIISFEPNSFEAYFNLGECQREINRFKDAIISYSEAIKLRPQHAMSYNHLGAMLYELGEFENSIDYFEKAIEIEPNYDACYINLGNTLIKLKLYNGGLGQYLKAIKINPNNDKYYYIIGLAYSEVGFLNEAINYFHKSLQINSQNVQSIYKLSTTLVDNKDYTSAKLYFEKAIVINDQHPYLLGSYISLKLNICNWDRFEYFKNKIKNLLLNDKQIIYPFDSLLLYDDIDLQKKSARLFSVNETFNIDLPFNKIDKPNKIKIGFYSSDLRFHPLTIWLAEQIENINKNIFELHAFSFSIIEDEMTLRIKKSFDYWHNVDNLTDNEIILLSRNIGINIGIDLNGYTKNHRFRIFSAKVAPIQINHLGYPGTLENTSIDYMIADINTISENIKEKINENIYYVPCNYTYDRKRKISNEYFDREMYDIPSDSFVFTCQNHCSRINPEVFGVWSNILDQIPKSILWLQNCGSLAKSNLLKEAINRGIDSNRLVFLDRETVPSNFEYERIGKYLATYKLADLFLDTWPYNGGTTVVDALSVGLPVITIEGITPSSRMASSALRALELTELIASNKEEYIKLAINLAKNNVLLNNIKQKAIKNKEISKLFNSVNNAKDIENALLKIFNDYMKKL